MMKILLLLFFVGFAAASVYDALDDTAELIYQDFMLDVEEASPLKEALGLSDDELFADVSDEEIKTKLGETLKELLDKVLEKVREGVKTGKEIKDEYIKKIKEITEQLKNLKVDVSDKAKELLRELRDRVTGYLRKLLDQISGKRERSVDDEDIEIAQGIFNLKDAFKKLKEKLLEHLTKEKIKEYIEKIFGKGNEMADALLELFNNKGEGWKQKLLDAIDKYLGKKEEKRSLKDAWEKIKNYFKDFHIDLKDKFQKLGNWLKEMTDKGLKLTKDKMENIKKIAREFRDHVKDTSVQVREEVLEFLRPYKDDLGQLWDQVKDAVKDMKNN